MCSERRPARRLLLLLATLLPLAAACGKKGDPLPPPRAVPARTERLAVRQRGVELLLDFPYPQTTVAGLALGGIHAVEVEEAVRPAPPEGQPLAVDGREFAAVARPLLKLAESELRGATSGDRIVLRFRLPEPLPEPPAARFYAVRTQGPKGEWSDRSALAGIVPREPPAPPQPLQLTARAEGIEIAWGEVAGAAGYHVYRREAASPVYGAPLHAAGAGERTFLDTGVRHDGRYVYTVCTLAAREPVIESAPAGERELLYEDRFPPPPPAGLTALPLAGAARLLWEASPAPDLAVYLVYRRDPAGELRLLTPAPITAHEFLDSGLAAGFTFSWRVTAIDTQGNEGEPAAVELALP
jgi:predicted small lipoprotein YifL